VSFPRERLHREVDVGVEKWKAVKLVESAYSLQVRDFVFVNIDTEEKLCIVLLASDSIRKCESSINLKFRLVYTFREASGSANYHSKA
jgi:hypothetical protein